MQCCKVHLFPLQVLCEYSKEKQNKTKTKSETKTNSSL